VAAILMIQNSSVTCGTLATVFVLMEALTEGNIAPSCC
jgi:hypothetical protein